MAKTVYCRMATAPTVGILATDVLRVGPFVRAMPPPGCTQIWLVLELVNCAGYARWDDVSLMEFTPP
jgi:hypothetical protein